MEKGGRKKNVIWPQSLLSDLPVGVEEELIKQQSCLPARHYRQDNIHSKCVKAEGKCMVGFCGRLWFFSLHFLRTLTVSVRIVIGKSAGNLLIAALLQHQCCELCCLRMQAFFCSLWLSVSVSAFFFVCVCYRNIGAWQPCLLYGFRTANLWTRLLKLKQASMRNQQLHQKHSLKIHRSTQIIHLLPTPHMIRPQIHYTDESFGTSSFPCTWM